MKPRPALVLLVTAALFGTACGTASGDARAHVAPCPATPVPPPAVASNGIVDTTVVFVDHGRETPAIPGRRATACRILPTQMRFPGPVTTARPLIVVAHGLDGDPGSLALLLDAWAAAGYVVAAPKFPTTKKDADGNSLRSESVDQARDLSFVIDSLIERSRTPGGPWSGRIDPHHIGAAGMSLGGLAIYGLVSNSCCRDRRIGAAI
ncbi:MAG: hypothetical protein ABJC79_05125, partial [Acidimicrobiia bacterium]